jgi:hypothetical protein
MPKKFREADIKKAIKKLELTPSVSWKKATLANLKALAREDAQVKKPQTTFADRVYQLFAPFLQLRYAAVAASFVVIAAGFFGYIYSRPINAFNRNLASAQEAILELKAGMDPQVAINNDADFWGLVPKAKAQSENNLNLANEQIFNLADQAFTKTKKAILIIERVEEKSLMLKMFAQVDTVQDANVDVLLQLVELLDDPQLIAYLNDLIRQTLEQNRVIELAYKQTEFAIENEEASFEFDFEAVASESAEQNPPGNAAIISNLEDLLETGFIKSLEEAQRSVVNLETEITNIQTAINEEAERLAAEAEAAEMQSEEVEDTTVASDEPGETSEAAQAETPATAAEPTPSTTPISRPRPQPTPTPTPSTPQPTEPVASDEPVDPATSTDPDPIAGDEPAGATGATTGIGTAVSPIVVSGEGGR